MTATKFALGAAVVALTLVGCKPSTPVTRQAAPVPAPAPSGAQMMGSDIGPALVSGKKLKCTVTATANEQSSTLYLDGQKYRMESMMSGKSVESVFDGTTFYVWGSAMPQGTMMQKDCLEDIKAMGSAAPAQGQPEYKTSDELVQQPNVKCDEVSAIDLSVPSTVNFVDQCAMLKNAMEAMKNLQMPR